MGGAEKTKVSGVRWFMAASALLLAGCGMSEPTFVEEYTSAYCNYAVACGGEATMVFDGYDKETCESVIGPRTEARMDSCRKYSGKWAKDCVGALLDAQCPEDGDVDAGQPVACSNVHTGCVEVAADDTDAGGSDDAE